MVILVDVKNAFNSAPWNGILEGLEKAGISPDIRRLLQSYLSDRRLIVETAGGTHVKKVTSGVPGYWWATTSLRSSRATVVSPATYIASRSWSLQGADPRGRHTGTPHLRVRPLEC